MLEVFNGFVETADGIEAIAIYEVEERRPEPFRFIVFYRGDDIDEWVDQEEFIARFGRSLYRNIEDFKVGRSISATKVLV